MVQPTVISMENKVEQPSLKTGNTVASLAAEVMTSDENVTADVEQQQLCVEESPAQPINCVKI